LQQKALKLVGRPIPISYTDKIVGIVTYRDGSIIDLVRQVKDTD
jgi:citrate lyase subunit alpha/citrate CoA-transferase